MASCCLSRLVFGWNTNFAHRCVDLGSAVASLSLRFGSRMGVRTSSTWAGGGCCFGSSSIIFVLVVATCCGLEFKRIMDGEIIEMLNMKRGAVIVKSCIALFRR